MRANIGNAVSAMQAPMNKVALDCEIPGVNRPGTVSSHGVSHIAIKNGTTMPANDTLIALFALDLKWSSCNVVPTKNMYKPTPSCAPEYSTFLVGPGKTAACASAKK